MERSTADILVKLYAVLSWLCAITLVFVAMIFSLFLGIMDSMMQNSIAGVRFLMSGFFFVFAIFFFFIGVGLWRYQEWARIATIVLSALVIVSGLLSPMPLYMSLYMLAMFGGPFGVFALA